MVMKSGERWHCMNPACLCAVLVETFRRIGRKQSPLLLRQHYEEGLLSACFPLPRILTRAGAGRYVPA